MICIASIGLGVLASILLEHTCWCTELVFWAKKLICSEGMLCGVLSGGYCHLLFCC